MDRRGVFWKVGRFGSWYSIIGDEEEEYFSDWKSIQPDTQEEVWGKLVSYWSF